MNKRTLVEISRDYVNYTAVDEKGKTYNGSCSPKEWEAYRLMEQLIEDGANDAMIDSLYSLAYFIGVKDTQNDYDEIA